MTELGRYSRERTITKLRRMRHTKAVVTTAVTGTGGSEEARTLSMHSLYFNNMLLMHGQFVTRITTYQTITILY